MDTINKSSFVNIRVLLALIFIVLINFNCGKKNDLPDNEVSIRIGWQIAWATQGQLAQILIHTNALQLNRLKGDFKSFTYGAPLSEAALADQLDVAFIGDQPAINLISTSNNWKIVARLMDFRVAIVIPPNSTITSVADLKGKTLAIPFGASTHRVALEMIKEAGLSQTDVNIINIDIQEQSDIINSSGGKTWAKVDAFASWDHNIALFESKGLAKILKSGTALGVVVMSEKFIKSHPEEASNFLVAFKLAYYYYALNQEQADKWFSEATQGKFDLALLKKVAEIEPNVKTRDISNIHVQLSEDNLKTLQLAADFAVKEKLIQNPVIITNSTNSEIIKSIDSKMISNLNQLKKLE